MLDQILALDLSSIPFPSIGSLDPGVLKIVIIGALVFLLLMLFAFTRHHIITHSMHGLWAGLALGIVGVLGLEGGGYYLYTNYVVGSKGAALPENVQVVIKDSAQSLAPVLGKTTEREQPTAKEVLTDYSSLEKEHIQVVKAAICIEEE